MTFYKTEIVDILGVINVERKIGVELDTAAAEGWTLDQTLPITSDGFTKSIVFIFKRETSVAFDMP
ncbi:MAG TPA: hypothetical protein VK171_16515 [Fimbriimonas sp.]|nr:hypothetical protein [Fimbriimonas sp.]